MLIDEIQINREKNLPLFQRVKASTFYSLLGRASKKMRGITFNYDHKSKIIETIIFFDSKLSEEEEEEMNIANTEVLADIYNEVTYFLLTLEIIPSSEAIVDKRGNWGWVYLRHEYDF
ncbi:hypothetical protein P255_00173 [Acinetobacter brisouii CIP 110357]|uniref:Uncharacterized protein n=1 Tax=Acinetobacter brisouii CIP 110357 TaxID=1341683 RepID=V2UWS0_9GAMM|nr:hypothetical protein [Acinetobacter brisouii]ENV48662.1 hypothetical protein F954_00397 [Acinetobacter brisouii ANC 4119]ESK53061.1 hypothetical protein P255_00173 [Acinetobacter brisouii CIP 110357]